eukprot:921665-Pyramimonas_sp.AAC.1
MMCCPYCPRYEWTGTTTANDCKSATAGANILLVLTTLCIRSDECKRIQSYRASLLLPRQNDPEIASERTAISK